MTPCQRMVDREKIHKMFHDRCILCFHAGVVIHEILPRSSGKEAMEIDNRVLLCPDCHEYVHRVGTIAMEKELIQKRVEALKRYASLQAQAEG